MLQFDVPVYSSKSKEEILHDYKGIFEGVGKLTGYQVKLHVDPEVPAVAQPVRRTPFRLRENVKEKIEEKGKRGHHQGTLPNTHSDEVLHNLI